MLKEQQNFYKNLYTKIDLYGCDDECSFLKENIPKLNEIDKNLCEQLISIEECGKTLKELPNNKASGSNGFTTDFYIFSRHKKVYL